VKRRSFSTSEILELLLKGYTNAQTAAKIGCSNPTVSRVLGEVQDKYGFGLHTTENKKKALELLVHEENCQEIEVPENMFATNEERLKYLDCPFFKYTD